MTNKEFAELKTFQTCCEAASIPATTRQASKYRRGKGIAYKAFATGYAARYEAAVKDGLDDLALLVKEQFKAIKTE